MKVPLSLVVRRLVSLVPALMMTTAALGTTPPDGSVTLPLIPARLVCAKTRVVVSATKIEKSRGARNRYMYESLRLVGQAGSLMPLVFPVVRILQKLWGGPPGLRGSPWTRSWQRNQSHPNGKAGQGAVRGPGGPPHNFCRPSGHVKNERHWAG